MIDSFSFNDASRLCSVRFCSKVNNKPACLETFQRINCVYLKRCHTECKVWFFSFSGRGSCSPIQEPVREMAQRISHETPGK